MKMLKGRRLYLVVTEHYTRGRSALAVARDAIAGGVDMIQMREKEMSRPELTRLAREFASLCAATDVPFIVNDDPFLARDVSASGVHLGQEDLKKFPLQMVRELLGRQAIIGVSTHSLDQFRQAEGWDVDYIAFGPLFPTRTKDYCIGTGDLATVTRGSAKPVFFIGGIDLSNVGTILAEGVRTIALISAIAGAPDITVAAGLFAEKLSQAHERPAEGMKVRINGAAHVVARAATLEDLVGERKLVPEKIVIEHNRRIIQRAAWAVTTLGDGDAVEIISFVGGG